MADYSTICGYTSPAPSDAATKAGGSSPMSFPRLAASPPPSAEAAGAVIGGLASASVNAADSLQREHAMRSLTEAVNSLHNLSVTRLPPSVASGPASANDNAIISDAEVRAFMTLAGPAANQAASQPEEATSSAEDKAVPAAVMEEERQREEASRPKFSPQHAAYSSPNLLFGPSAVRVSSADQDLDKDDDAAAADADAVDDSNNDGCVLRSTASRLTNRRREGVTRSWHSCAGGSASLSEGSNQSPHDPHPSNPPDYMHHVGLRLAGFASSSDSMGLAVYPRSSGPASSSSGTGPFLTAPQAPGNMTEISLSEAASAAATAAAEVNGAGGGSGPSSTNSSLGLQRNAAPSAARRRFDISDDEEEAEAEEEAQRVRRSVIRDISLSPSAGSNRTGSSGVTSGLEDYLFKPGGLDLGGAGGDEDNFSLPGSGRLLRGGLVLPSVEDGLSSGANSEVNSPRISPRAVRRSRPSAGSGAHSKSPYAVSSSGGLLNQGLMRAITNDIQDIKKAIAENVDLPPVLPSIAAAPGPCKDLRDIVRPPQPPPPPPPPPPASNSTGPCDSPGSDRVESDDSVWTKRPSCHSSSSSNALDTEPSATSTSASAVGSQSENASPTCKTSNEAQRNSQQQRTVPEATSNAVTKEYESDEDTEKLLTKAYDRDERVEIPELQMEKENQEEKRRRGREVAVRHPDNPAVLIEGVLFRARYLGSTQLVTEGQPSKATRMVQAQEAVGRIKAPEGESQPSTDVDLFVSTEKIMVLNTNLKEIMMDHSLKTISYIADIGDVLVIMARRRLVPMSSPDHEEGSRSAPGRQQIKVICHVFESDEAQLIAQSIGHAFQVAYMEFLKANGIEDPSVFKEMDYQEVLNQQEIFGEELALFSDKQQQKEVIIPKQKGEPLGVVIVESGWGSMIPTVVLANMKPTGPAARCGQLNIGDQIIAVNGHSLVGLPLAQCQQRVKMCRKCSSVQLSLVSCSPVVQVRIKRPDLKYQLGFSLQNGVICSLLRGGIAERGGVRVGHRIIEINGESVVGVAHERMVNMLSTCVGEIRMRTMPTCIFRLMTGQEEPVYI